MSAHYGTKISRQTSVYLQHEKSGKPTHYPLGALDPLYMKPCPAQAERGTCWGLGSIFVPKSCHFSSKCHESRSFRTLSDLCIIAPGTSSVAKNCPKQPQTTKSRKFKLTKNRTYDFLGFGLVSGFKNSSKTAHRALFAPTQSPNETDPNRTAPSTMSRFIKGEHTRA